MCVRERVHACVCVCIRAYICECVVHASARNKDQKLVSHFLKIGYFIGYYSAVPLKMYGKYGRSK